MHLLNRSDLALAAGYFANAAYYSRQWSKLVSDALKQYGDHGPQISGICRDHFPESLKDRLRTLAHLVTEENEKGRKARPAGVHSATLDKLARMICKRDGTGFYGYRA